MNPSSSSRRIALYHRLFSFRKADENSFPNPIGDKTVAFGDLLMKTDIH